MDFDNLTVFFDHLGILASGRRASHSPKFVSFACKLWMETTKRKKNVSLKKVLLFRSCFFYLRSSHWISTDLLLFLPTMCHVTSGCGGLRGFTPCLDRWITHTGCDSQHTCRCCTADMWGQFGEKLNANVAGKQDPHFKGTQSPIKKKITIDAGFHRRRWADRGNVQFLLRFGIGWTVQFTSRPLALSCLVHDKRLQLIYPHYDTTANRIHRESHLYHLHVDVQVKKELSSI